MDIQDFLNHFENVRSVGQGKYKLSCTVHQDDTPSVSLDLQPDGNALMYCHGCSANGSAILEAVDLPVNTLFNITGAAPTIRAAAGAEEPVDLDALDQYLQMCSKDLDHAEKYLEERFHLPLEAAKELRLGYDDGGRRVRPNGFGQFGDGKPRLIIPLMSPDGIAIGAQGRSIDPEEPLRWMSLKGSGWSRLGTFAWDYSDKPIVICEGPTDALAVVAAGGRAIVVRGAGLAESSASVIKQWIGELPAVVVGDNDEAGQKFARSIANHVGIVTWTLPEGYGDIAEFWKDGNPLDELFAATGVSEATPLSTYDLELVELREWIERDLAGAARDEELKERLRALPNWDLNNMFLDIVEASRAHRAATVTQQRLDALQSALRAAPRQPPGGGGNGLNVPGGGGGNGRPHVRWDTGDQLDTTENNVRAAMDVYEGGIFFQVAAGEYAKVVEGVELKHLEDPGVKSMLAAMGNWEVIDGNAIRGHVPSEACRMVRASTWECKLPMIRRRVEVPFMLPNGVVVREEGFHEESGVYLLPKDRRIIVPEVPEFVGDEDLARAKSIILEALEDFMFLNDASLANTVAVLLTSPLRELIPPDSPMTPLFVVNAPQEGSGKGTVVRACLSTAGVGGSELTSTVFNSDDVEFEKKLVSQLMKKPSYLFLDNIRTTVSSSVLEQMLTSPLYDGRRLGHSEVNSLSTQVLWCATLQATGAFNRDLLRRAIPCELRKNWKGSWKHKNIEQWLSDQRGNLIWACFVIARRWIQDGKPVHDVPDFPSFQGWAEVFGGMVTHTLQLPGFLTNKNSFAAAQDQISVTIGGILERWLDTHGEEALPARFAIEETDDPELHNLLELRNPTPNRVILALTRKLTAVDGHIVGGTHVWRSLGKQEFKKEGLVNMFMLLPLEQ